MYDQFCVHKTEIKMRKVLINIAFLLVCILSFSQERVDTNTYLQFDKTTKTLKNIVGYSNITGKWERQKNQVYYGLIDDTQKFNKLTIKTLTYNDTLYYALIRNYDGSGIGNRIVKSGDVYLYQGGGSTMNRNVLYFFTATQFEQLFNLDKETKTIYSFKSFIDYNTYNDKSDINKLTDYILKSANKNKENDFMEIRITDDGKMVRFLLPYQRNEIWKKNADLFHNNYFEMPLKNFEKWLEPITPTEK